MKRKLLSIFMLLCSTMMFAQFSGSGTGTESDPYLIYNENQLAQVANFLGQEGVVFKLQKDLNISNYIAENNPNQGWTPIGVESSPFQGKFYGNGHTISGVFINRTSTNHVGFWGYISGATISDLTLMGTSISGADGVGGVSYATNSSISNCSVSLTSSESLKGSNSCGGIVGIATNSVSIDNCAFEGNIKGVSNYIGGIAGDVTGSTINNCSVVGNVDGNGNSSATAMGGIAGRISATNINNSTITGNVSNTNSVGGIVGCVRNTCLISNVSCIGDVSGTEMVAGVAGGLEVSASVTFDKAFSKGKISNTGNYTGGIVGMSDGPRIAGMTDCSHFGDIIGQNYVGGLVGHIVGTQEPCPVYSVTEYNSYNIGGSSYNSTIVNGTQVAVPINNCTAIGNINGKVFVGGLIGKDEPSYTYSYISYVVLIFVDIYGEMVHMWEP